jgi:hypothetical protein
MSTVARRCPNCGSVQEHAGSCETCHESDVRYFCANHEPGRWLDTPGCADCGATLHAGPTRGAPPTRPARPIPPSPIPPAPPPPRRTTARPVPPRRAEPRYEPPVEAPYDPPYVPPPRMPAPARPPRPTRPTLPELLRRAREVAGERDGGWPVDPGALRPAVRVGLPSVVGCVGRIIMLVLVLLALAAAAFSYVVWY